MERIAAIALAIVGVATIAVVVQSPFTAAVIRAGGDAFSSSIRSAMGR